MQLMRSSCKKPKNNFLCVKNKTHENIDYGVNEDKLYELDKLSRDEK